MSRVASGQADRSATSVSAADAGLLTTASELFSHRSDELIDGHAQITVGVYTRPTRPNRASRKRHLRSQPACVGSLDSPHGFAAYRCAENARFYEELEVTPEWRVPFTAVGRIARELLREIQISYGQV